MSADMCFTTAVLGRQTLYPMYVERDAPKAKKPALYVRFVGRNKGPIWSKWHTPECREVTKAIARGRKTQTATELPRGAVTCVRCCK